MTHEEIEWDDDDDEAPTSGTFRVDEWSGDEWDDGDGPADPKTPMNRKMLGIGVALVAVAGIVLLLVFGGKLGGSSIPGAEIRKQYEAVDEAKWKERHMVVLQHVANKNMPSTWDDFVTIEVKSPKGTVVQFEVAKHPLRVGTDDDWAEIAVDGPHAAAICEITGYSLPHYWMVDHIHVQARKDKGVIHFYPTCEIATALQVACPKGSSSKKEFILKRTDLVRAWMEKKGVQSDQLQSGHYKDVVLPVDGSTSGPQQRTLRDRLTGRTRIKSGKIEIYGGYNDAGNRIQPLSGGHHIKGFFDYPQGIRFVKKEVKVNGETVPLADFVGSAQYAAEFGFQTSTIEEPYYPYTDELKKFVEEHK